MSRRKLCAVALAVLLVAGAVPVSAVAGASQSEAKAYAGAHVTFEMQSDAVVDYAVDGETVLSSVEVQSQSDAESDSSVDVTADTSLSAVTDLDGSALAMQTDLDAGAQATVSAEMTAESGATLTAHDNGHGELLVRAEDQSQYLVANVSADASAETTEDGRVVVTSDDGAKTAFVVVGEGDVTVNENGDVSADLAQGSTLVVRTYPDERDDDEKAQERMIQEGELTAAVYAFEREGEVVTDTVKYGAETTVESASTAEGEAKATFERSKSEGKVVLVSVSDAVVSEVDSVTVGGSAAVRASSTSELRSAVGGSQAKFLTQASGEATTDVLVAVTGFSEKTVTVEDEESDSTAGDGDGSGGDSDGSGDDGSGVTGPGFGVGTAALALVATALLVRRRH